MSIQFNPAFTGYYMGNTTMLSKKSQKLVEASYALMADSRRELEAAQKINKGKFVLANSEQSEKFYPVLTAEKDGSSLKMYNTLGDNFKLVVKNGEKTEGLSVIGSSIHYTSSEHPLQENDYKILSSGLLEKVDNLIKNCLSVFINK